MARFFIEGLALWLVACAPTPVATSAVSVGSTPPPSPAPTAPVASPVVASPPAIDRRPADPTRVEFASPSNGLTGVSEALRGHAAAFIPCPGDQLSVQALRSGPNPWFSSFLVDGCGKRVAYGLCETGASGTDCYTVTSFFSLPAPTSSR
jgi:hypothetical protein